MDITIRLRWITFAPVLFLLQACGGGGGDAVGPADSPAGDPPTGELRAPVADITGTWNVTESGVSDCPGVETFANGPTEIAITQDGNVLTVETPAATFSGAIDGDRVRWTGSYPSGDGTVTIDAMDLVLSADGAVMSGAAAWTFAGGGTTCSGSSQAINATRVFTVDPPPAAPSGLSANPRSPSSVDLVWNDNSDDEAGFRIERRRSDDPDAAFAQIASLDADTTAFTDRDLNALTAYDYRVRAFNDGGNSKYSNIFTVTTLAPPVPAPLPPSDLTLTVDSPNAITLAWSDNSANESSFKIERSRNADTGFEQIASVDGDIATHQDTGLEAATQYYYRVRAANDGGNSAYSNVATATTLPMPVAPAAPAELTATARSSNRIDLRWADRSDDETAFRIERSGSPNGDFSQIATVVADVTEFGDTGLEQRTTYYYRVRATNDGLDSEYSNTAEATTFLFDFPF